MEKNETINWTEQLEDIPEKMPDLRVVECNGFISANFRLPEEYTYISTYNVEIYLETQAVLGFLIGSVELMTCSISDVKTIDQRMFITWKRKEVRE